MDNTLQDSITFSVNHEVMTRGLYIPDVKRIGDYEIFTIDMRLRKPYADAPMTEVEAHTFEHNFATSLREAGNSHVDMEVLYFGPMGCMTGFYAVIAVRTLGIDEQAVKENLLTLLFEACVLMRLHHEVVAKSKLQCGNVNTLGTVEDIKQLITDLEALIVSCKETNTFNDYVYIKGAY